MLPPGSTLGDLYYKDNGSFIITLNGKETKIIEKVNTSAYWNYTGKCTIVQLKQGSGTIHVAGIESTKITQPSSGAEPAIIEIMFSRYPTIWPLLQFTCPNLNRGGTYTSTSAQVNAMASSMPALPQHIKFAAIEEEQTYVQFGEEGGQYYLKITVKQVKDD